MKSTFKIIAIILLISFSTLSFSQTAEVYAGSGLNGYVNGTGSTVRFSTLAGVCVGLNDTVYVCDRDNNCIRKITPSGTVTTFAGSATGASGSTNGTGTAALFYYPTDIAFDYSGNLFVADMGNHRIRKITPNGVVSDFAGSTQGEVNGTGSNAKFFWPSGLAIDTANNIYVASSGAHNIRKISPSAVVTLFAGNATSGYVDDTTTNAKFNTPNGITIDRNGNFYIADTRNHRIRKITPGGSVTTIAGSGTGTFADGNGTSASFKNPANLCVDTFGNIYVTDQWNYRIRKINPNGDVTTIGGGSSPQWGDGIPAVSKFSYPVGIALNSKNELIIGDGTSHNVRKIRPSCYDTNNLVNYYDSTYTSYYIDYVNGWANYCTEDFKLLLSLNTTGSGAVVAANEVSIKLGKTEIYSWTNSCDFFPNRNGGAIIDRRWNVSATTQPTGGNLVPVRFYYQNGDFYTLADALSNHNGGASGYPTSLSNINQMETYKLFSQSGFTDPTNSGITGKICKNGSTASDTVWVAGTTTSEINYAEFKVSSFSGGGIGAGAGNSPLPVELIHFMGKYLPNNNIQLNWITASEINCSHFIIEKSEDGVLFNPIGKTSGNGNAVQSNKYQFIDPNLSGNLILYYRLKQVDFNEFVSILPTIKINSINTKTDLIVFPNPSKGLITILNSDREINQVVVLDASGKELFEYNNTSFIDISFLNPGIYYLRITSENETNYKRIIKE